jgi:hypothetical protein
MSLFMLAFTALDAGFTVALGIALPLSTLPRPITVALVMAVRFIAMIYNFIFIIVLFGMLIWDQRPLLAAGVTLLIGILLNWIAIRAAQIIAIRGEVTAPE